MQISYGSIPLLQDYLIQSARTLPEKVALVCMKQRITYGEIEAKSNVLANSLVSAGVQRGDRVIIFADNTVETVISFWAALKANAVASVVNPLTKADKLAYLLQDCRPTALLTEARLHEVYLAPARTCLHLKSIIISGEIADNKLSELPLAQRWADALNKGDSKQAPARSYAETDLAAIIYTSGSTGDPKGVMLTNRNMHAACTSVVSYLELQQDDVILGVLPLAFDYGLYQMIMAFSLGARLVLERSFIFPVPILKLIESEGVTVFPGVPTIFSILAELKSLKDFNLSRIRSVTNTAAALPLKHIQMLKQVFPAARIFSMYGLTECKRCTYLPPPRPRPKARQCRHCHTQYRNVDSGRKRKQSLSQHDRPTRHSRCHHHAGLLGKTRSNR